VLETIEHVVGDPLQGSPPGVGQGFAAPSTKSNVFH